MLSLLALFGASFIQVFLLGLNSQFCRDQRAALCFVLSWNISAAQFVYTRVVALSPDPWNAFFAAGMGGSLGIVCSIYLYKWLLPKLKKR